MNLKIKTSIIVLISILSFSSCIKDEIENIYWETDSHFTDGHMGSYTLVYDINTPQEKTYTNLADDILMSAHILALPGVVSTETDATSFVLATAVGEIGSTLQIGECDDCVIFMVAPDGNNADDIAIINFVSTGGTIKRESKDKVVIDAQMVDNNISRTLNATIYLGAITLDGE